MTNEQTSKSSTDQSIFPILILMGGFGLLFVLLLGNVPRQARVTPTPQPTVVADVPTTAPVLVGDNGISYDLALVDDGRSSFQTICAACHGLDAHGIPGLGKNLAESAFIDSQTDRQLLFFITTGRPVYDPANTTGIEMPARGGNPSLTDDDINAIIAYLRTIPAQEAVQVAQVPAQIESSEPFLLPTLVGSDRLSSEQNDVTSSILTVEQSPDAAMTYTWACSTCHGADGLGVPNFGPSLLYSTPVISQDTQGLIDFLSQGWTFDDVQTRFPHPPRGGYPALSDDELSQLVQYLYTLNSAQ